LMCCVKLHLTRSRLNFYFDEQQKPCTYTMFELEFELDIHLTLKVDLLTFDLNLVIVHLNTGLDIQLQCLIEHQVKLVDIGL